MLGLFSCLGGVIPTSGIAAWYDSTGSYIIYDGAGKASSWQDRWTGAHHATQSTAANKPTRYGSGIGNAPALAFDGSAAPNHDILISDDIDLTTATGVTWFVILRDASAATSIVVEKGTNVGTGPGFYTAINNGAASVINMGWNSASGGPRDYRTTSTIYTGDRPLIITSRVDGTQPSATEMTMRINGVVQALTAVAGVGVETSGGFGNSPIHIGARANGTVPFAGFVAGVLIYRRALSDAECKRVEIELGRMSQNHEAMFVPTLGSPLMPMGDSLTRGLNADLGGYRKPASYLYLTPDYRCVGSQEQPTGYFHEGNNAETLVQMNAAYAGRWAANPAGILLLMGGTNDFALVDGPTALTRLDTLLTTAEGTAPAPSRILVSNLPPLANAANQAKAAAFNGGLAATLATHPTAELVDYAATIVHSSTSPILDGDGVHLTEWAYEDMAHVFAGAVKGSAPVAAITDPDGATLEAWYRADLGFAAAQWDDLSGNARHLLQANGALQLSTAAGALGQTCVVANGTGWYQTAAWTLAQPACFLIVGRLTLASKIFLDGSSGVNRNLIWANASGFLELYAGGLVTTATDIRGVAGLYTGAFDTTASVARINQKAMKSGGAGSGANGALTAFAAWDGSAAMTGEIYEIIVYSQIPRNLRAIEQTARARYTL